MTITTFFKTALTQLSRLDRATAPASRAAVLMRSLRAMRTHLGMDVAFISEFAQGRRHFRYVDASNPAGSVQVGGSDLLEHSYCQRVIDGRLPELMTNACTNEEAMTLATTVSLRVGAHLSVPIQLTDGRVFGTFCCFSFAPDESLTSRDLDMMRVFGDMIADQIEQELDEQERKSAAQHRIDAVLRSGGLTTVYQPIFQSAGCRIVGFEALSRFSAAPQRTPDLWFEEAARVGLGIELESRAIQIALMGLERLPRDVYLSINASPETILYGDLKSLLTGCALDRMVVEVTEHAAIERYDDIAAVVKPLQECGLRIAIDDVGAGYASFRHVLNLAPHIIKLDVSITRGVDVDRSRRALAAALCSFASATHCKIIAEGVETLAELVALRELGVNEAQGYFLGRPMSLDQAAKLAEEYEVKTRVMPGS